MVVGSKKKPSVSLWSAQRPAPCEVEDETERERTRDRQLLALLEKPDWLHQSPFSDTRCGLRQGTITHTTH